MSVLSILPPAVRSYVYDFDARARRLALLRGVGLALAVFVIWMLVCCGIDRVGKLEPTARLCLLGGGVLAVVAILARPVRGVLRRRVDWVETADRIERHSPQFGQRLVTVTSRVLGPAEHRGSDDMLRELLRDVDRQAATQDAADLLPLRKIARPWVVLAVALLAAIGLMRVPGLGMDVLAVRFLAPLADVQPVTMTRIDVLTGSRDVIQSEPLLIEVDVGNLAGGVVSLLVSEDEGAHWSRSTMEPVAESTPTTAEGVVTANHGGGGDVAAALGAHSQTRPAAAGATRFVFRLASVDRDLRYHVTGGDAVTRTYAVRVRRPPAVERFRVHYEYPAYTGRSALTVVNSDGVIEAPIGTRATLTVVATEPLDKALLTIGGEKTLMAPPSPGNPAETVPPGEDPGRVRVASFVVRKNGKYELDLISDRDVPGGGPATTAIRATPDGKPLVRLSQAGENLRLHPREILPLAYEALDDYGIARLVLRAQVNSAAPVEAPIALRSDPRRQADEHEFDLATMPLGIGDVVTLQMIATDRAGQASTSEPVQVLVSPRSVDLVTYQRVAELNAAAALAATLHEQLTGAAQALEEVDREAAAQSLAYTAARNRSTRQLTDAAQTATLMRLALFRGLVKSRSPELSNTLVTWIDHAEAQSWLAEDLFRRSGAPRGMGPGPRDLLAQALEGARVVRDELKLAAAGERAAALLADRENLLASQKKAEAEQAADVKQRLLQTLQRAREEIAAGAKEIGLDPAAADLDAQLKARVEGALALLKSKGPIDFAAAAQAWAQALQADPTQPVMLDERMAAAAQAEAVRFDGDLLRASDFQLASRAAARIAILAMPDPAMTPVGPPAFAEFAAALTAVQREHEINRRPIDVRPPDEAKQVRAGASAAREVLRRWAGDIPDPAAPRPAAIAVRSRQKQAEELALRAGAEAFARNYEAAAALDVQLARELRDEGGDGGGDVRTAGGAYGPLGPPVPLELVERQQREVGRVMEKARAIDDIGQRQDTVAKQTETAQPAQATGLAGQQREVAEAIERVDGQPAGAGGTRSPVVGAGSTSAADAVAADPNWRGRAAAAVLAAQEAFALMPQQLAAAQEALPAWQAAIMRAEQAKKDAAAMPGERQPAAQRAAAQAGRDAADAADRFQARRQPVSPAAAGQLSASLEPFAPETNGAVDVITRALVPALQRLDDASKTGDPAAFTRAADEARQSIEAAQKELAFAQESLTARDPLVAAKWFARAAADSLARTPPDLRAAQVRQKETSNALSRAWDRTIHDAAAMRMASLPAMQSLYAPPAAAAPDPAKVAAAVAAGEPRPDPAALLAPGLAAVREWARLRPREPQDLNAALRDSEPPGFEEPLRLYFESLGKSRAEPGK